MFMMFSRRTCFVLGLHAVSCTESDLKKNHVICVIQKRTVLKYCYSLLDNAHNYVVVRKIWMTHFFIRLTNIM